jgi:hypothetical protein
MVLAACLKWSPTCTLPAVDDRLSSGKVPAEVDIRRVDALMARAAPQARRPRRARIVTVTGIGYKLALSERF